jgi:hypothetical protein
VEFPNLQLKRHKKNDLGKPIVTEKVIIRTETQRISPAWATCHTAVSQEASRQAAEE